MVLLKERRREGSRGREKEKGEQEVIYKQFYYKVKPT